MVAMPQRTDQSTKAKFVKDVWKMGIKARQDTKEEYKAHCLILPFPSQGHINPMLQFAKRLRHKGVKITLAATKHIFKTMQDFSGSVSVETISDGYDEGGLSAAKNYGEYLARFRKVGTETLEELIKRLKNSRCALDCIVYDAFIPWSLDVAKTLGLVGAAFFTQSCAVDQIYYHVDGNSEGGAKFTHGNIKSSNILLNPDLDGRVSDFGLSHLTNYYPKKYRGAGYRAPEVIEMRKVTQKSDVYSFGVVLLEMLTGKSPIQSSGYNDVVDLPRW
ncbi:UDP-glycosyltransferase 74G1-like, partial [Olea europaea subsp. europaea]